MPWVRVCGCLFLAGEVQVEQALWLASEERGHLYPQRVPNRCWGAPGSPVDGFTLVSAVAGPLAVTRVGWNEDILAMRAADSCNPVKVNFKYFLFVGKVTKRNLTRQLDTFLPKAFIPHFFCGLCEAAGIIHTPDSINSSSVATMVVYRRCSSAASSSDLKIDRFFLSFWV